MSTEIALPEKNDEAVKALDWLKGFRIESNEDFLKVDQALVQARSHERRADELFDEAVEAAHEAHKKALAAKKLYLGPVVEFKRLGKSMLDAWNQEQERLRRLEEAKLREQARKLEEDRQLAEASLAEQSGDKDTAQAILEEPVQVPTVVLPKSTPKTATVIRKMWDARVVNPSLVPDDYWVLDEAKIKQAIRNSKGAVRIPGVEAFERVV